MRGILVAAVGLLAATPLRAGVYSTAQPVDGPRPTKDGAEALSFTHFRDVFTNMFKIGLEQPIAPQRQEYLKQRAALEAKVRAGSATVEDRVNLGACLIRLRQYEQAVDVLSPAVGERRNFMVFANLGTAHQLAGRLDRALSYLEQAKDVWPDQWPGLSQEQLRWYRQAEDYQRKLVRLRFRESVRQPAGRGRAPATVDELFTGPDGAPLRFVGENGQYEAGKLAPAERQKLPLDAVAIVQQLLLWMPDDTRLYWLLGELYNATGDVDAAAKIFEECEWSRRFDTPTLRAHRQVVQEAKPKNEPLVLEQATPEAPAAPAPVAPEPSWLPEGRQLLIVGGVAGVLVLALAYFQVRELRRRRLLARRKG
jgi:tetratricopeptide (TPR) repeat protein